ncbi:hypothetical protein [Mesomycoplasma ovipneumoniae]|uniref:hypothetical protein n=1 Tax=Mesomycoplasma ovipneumoniae TaxID=29562 RepID=UPI002163CB46|nr:hypothetical protein [Mesomycoplasma ovipneumoniae]UVO16222.1 hypothetical protein KW545_01425 [Mesomycoplasma ovipneumoniae]
MKNLERVNHLSLANVIVTQPYENAYVKLKNLICGDESNILDKIQDEDTNNLLIRRYASLVDELGSFTYKDLNYIFRGKVFNNQDQKNKAFQKLRSTCEIYKKSHELKSKNSLKRGKRSLFKESQRLTIEDWIDRIQRVIDQNIAWSSKASDYATSLGIGAASTAVATAASVGALISLGPIGLFIIASIGTIGTLTQLGFLIDSVVATPYYWDVAQKITKELNSLKAVFRIIKSSNNTALENRLKEEIRKIIANINELSGNIINFNDFDMEEILAWEY